MKTAIGWFSGLLLIVTLLISCKKSSTPTPNNSCKISSFTGTGSFGTTPETFTYNNSGQISELVSGSTTVIFTYSSNGMEFQSFQGDPSNSVNLREAFTGTTNSQGEILGGTLNLYDNGGNVIAGEQTSYTFTFDNQGEITQMVSQVVNSSQQVTTYTWQNGNLTGITLPSGSVTMEYYTNKSSSTGDYFWLTNLYPNNFGTIHTRNLLKTYTQGGTISNFSYTFDAQGKISNLTVTGAINGTLTYQWNCTN